MQRKRRKRRKLKRISVFVISLVFILIIIGIIPLIKYDTKNNYQNNQKEVHDKEPLEYKLNLIMAGDALVHDRLYNDAKRQAEYNGYNFKPYLRLIKEKVSNYDLGYYNQETILGGTDIGLSSYPSFNSPQELGDAMIDTGFNLVSLATNHTLDRGEKAIIKSREYWNKQENIHAIGSYTSHEEKNNLETKILEKNNIKYAILNYTYGTNGINVPKGKEYLVNLWHDELNYEEYKETVIKDINNLRDKVDVLIVAMHWGREYTHVPTELEKKTANFLASLDVDIIIGTHPHVIQPVEWIDDTLVFYSLGNFISAQTSSSCSNYKCNIGLLSSLTITKTIDEDNTIVTIDNVKNELIYTYHNNYQDYLVIPFSNKEIKNYLKDYQKIYEDYAKIIETDNNKISTIDFYR